MNNIFFSYGHDEQKSFIVKIKDNKNKIHPDLIPYEKLSENVKQYDHNSIMNIPVLLKKQELKIIKRDEKEF